MIKKEDVLAILDEAKAKVDALVDESGPDVAELQKKIEDLSAEILDLKAQMLAKDELLAKADSLAKEIDASIPG